MPNNDKRRSVNDLIELDFIKQHIYDASLDLHRVTDDTSISVYDAAVHLDAAIYSLKHVLDIFERHI
jgi:hypothetical protein